MNKAIVLVLLLPACKQVHIQKEFRTLDKQAQQATGSEIYWRNGKKRISPCAIQDQIQHGLSRQEAVSIALQNNPLLLADFETLGIAKADLVQAGLFNNPQVNAVFRDPRDGRRTNVEAQATLSITDFWQVPLRKKVAQDEVTITSSRILNAILQTSLNTNIAYNRLLLALAQLHNAEKIVQETTNLRDRIYYRQQYGFTTDLDTNLADVLMGNAELAHIDAQNELQAATLALQELLGITPLLPRKIAVIDSLDDTTELPSLEILLNWALEHHPLIQIAQLRVQQYKHLVSFEKSRRIQTLDFGVGWERDSDPDECTRIGPALNIGVPIFDYNQAHVARARYLYNQAQELLNAEKLRIQREVISIYTTVTAYQQQLEIYACSMLPANERAIEYTIAYNKQMQISMPTIFQTYLTLIQTRKMYNQTQFNALASWAQLQKAVGKRLQDF